MIKAVDFPFHVEQLGGVEEFNEYIRRFKELAPDMSEKRIKYLLEGEEISKPSPSFWINPWQY